MSMGDAVDLFDYWREHPPTHLVLGAVHMAPGDASTERRRKVAGPTIIDEAETQRQMFELQRMTGGAIGTPEQIPPRLAELADWAEEMVSKMKLN